MKTDLNDFAYFAEVVANGGFSAAARALRQPKSKLSRRILALEKRLGLRLIERSSRRFRVTEVGEAFYQRCRAILAEAERAEALVANALAEPHGRIRFSCPTGMIGEITGLISEFLTHYPKVRLQLIAIDRPVDLIEERVDLALRVRTVLAGDAELTVRSLGISTRILVACPQMASRLSDLSQLTSFPTLATTNEEDIVAWYLETDDGRSQVIQHEPRLACGDFAAIREAAIAGQGIALLPDHLCQQALDSGQLVRVLCDWRGHRGIVHLVFTTRRGLPPAVRALIDHLAGGFSKRLIGS